MRSEGDTTLGCKQHVDGLFSFINACHQKLLCTCWCELWTENFDSMFALVKKYITDVWEVRKVKLYGEPCSTQPQSQSSAGDRGEAIMLKFWVIMLCCTARKISLLCSRNVQLCPANVHLCSKFH